MVLLRPPHDPDSGGCRNWQRDSPCRLLQFGKADSLPAVVHLHSAVVDSAPCAGSPSRSRSCAQSPTEKSDGVRVLSTSARDSPPALPPAARNVGCAAADILFPDIGSRLRSCRSLSAVIS